MTILELTKTTRIMSDKGGKARKEWTPRPMEIVEDQNVKDHKEERDREEAHMII